MKPFYQPEDILLIKYNSLIQGNCYRKKTIPKENITTFFFLLQEDFLGYDIEAIIARKII
jgi:hypothetical protein